MMYTSLFNPPPRPITRARPEFAGVMATVTVFDVTVTVTVFDVTVTVTVTVTVFDVTVLLTTALAIAGARRIAGVTVCRLAG
eukprot:2002648-Rhodomonas_salina.1